MSRDVLHQAFKLLHPAQLIVFFSGPAQPLEDVCDMFKVSEKDVPPFIMIHRAMMANQKHDQDAYLPFVEGYTEAGFWLDSFHDPTLPCKKQRTREMDWFCELLDLFNFYPTNDDDYAADPISPAMFNIMAVNPASALFSPMVAFRIFTTNQPLGTIALKIFKDHDNYLHNISMCLARFLYMGIMWIIKIRGAFVQDYREKIITETRKDFEDLIKLDPRTIRYADSVVIHFLCKMTQQHPDKLWDLFLDLTQIDQIREVISDDLHLRKNVDQTKEAVRTHQRKVLKRKHAEDQQWCSIN